MVDMLGGEWPIAIKVVVGLFVVFGLLAVFFWGLRRFGGERLGNSGARGRQPQQQSSPVHKLARTTTRQRDRHLAARPSDDRGNSLPGHTAPNIV